MPHTFYKTEGWTEPHSLYAGTPTQITLERLLRSWEELRQLDEEGYRTSYARPMSTWLIGIHWADDKVTGPSPGRGTACSPFTVQSIAMCLSQQPNPATPKLADGRPVPLLYSSLANSRIKASSHADTIRQYGLVPKRDNGWARSNIFFNLARAIHPKDMRRGDAVGITWTNGGGHATFCWDVHLDANGEVDAFLYVSSNGSFGADKKGYGRGITVGGTHNGVVKLVREDPPRYEVKKTPLFADDDYYVQNGHWVTWKDPKTVDLRDCRVKPKSKHPSKVMKVAVARFHGMVAPEPYAQGGKAHPGEQAAPVEIRDAASQQVSDRERTQNPIEVRDRTIQPAQQDAELATDGQLQVERRLKALYDLGKIDADPGEPDNVNDPQTQAAVKDFQGKKGLKVDGIAGPKTKAALKTAYEKALRTPEGKAYVTTGRTARDEGGGEPAGGGGGEPTVEALYWRHGSARPGDRVRLCAWIDHAEGKSYAIKLLAGDRTVDTGQKVRIRDGRGQVIVALPKDLTTDALVEVKARLDDLAFETEAPLYVRPHEAYAAPAAGEIREPPEPAKEPEPKKEPAKKAEPKKDAAKKAPAKKDEPKPKPAKDEEFFLQPGKTMPESAIKAWMDSLSKLWPFQD